MWESQKRKKQKRSTRYPFRLLFIIYLQLTGTENTQYRWNTRARCGFFFDNARLMPSRGQSLAASSRLSFFFLS